MSGDSKLSEWIAEFQALVREGSDSIEDIFDVQFRHRFSTVIDQAAGANWRRWGDRDEQKRQAHFSGRRG